MIRSTLSFSRALLLAVFLLVALIGATAVHASHSPDREIRFTREVPASCAPSELAAAFNDIGRWPEWFKTLASVEVAGDETKSARTPHVGDTLILHIDSKRSPWSKFILKMRVAEFEPGKRVRLLLLEDSSGRIQRLFDRVEWDVELDQNGAKPLVRGVALAHTHHWRSRFVGTFAERALMNQLYYPDLIKLAELTRSDDGFEFVPRSTR